MNEQNKAKIIKDPVHGYIEVENFLISVINTPEFQRLKFIEQGSFRVLYPAARHDRFIHSLGVYHLARMFSENFVNNVKIDLFDLKIQNDEFEKYRATFHYAALLHDIGHAPFSHTTESFFEQATTDNEKKIVSDLKAAVNKYIDSLNCSGDEKSKRKDLFVSEYETIIQKPKPHEIISATILIKDADLFLGSGIADIDLELAARMVIGCTYSYKECSSDELDDLGIRNCFIRLLNSDTMDVDKLDYITRDSFMTGFKNVLIDINRIAKSVTAIKDENNHIYPAFRKNSISVIDNLFRAKKEQSNWVLSHPVVLYEAALLRRTVYDLWNTKNIKTIFSMESLGRTKGKAGYVLLNDSDIITKLKEKIDFNDVENIYNEVFNRGKRRSAVWKSFYEYELFFKKEKNEAFQVAKPLMDVLAEKYFVLNNSSSEKILKSKSINDKAKTLVRSLKNFSDENNVKFSFVMINTKNQFDLKINPERIFFKFDKTIAQKNYVTYSELVGSTVIERKDEEFFYFFSEDKIDESKLPLLRNVFLKNFPKSDKERA